MFFKYYNKLLLGEAIESDYLMWKSEQHRLTKKYEIMSSLLPLVKHNNVNMEENNNPFKMTCQHCNGFITCYGRSVELL